MILIRIVLVLSGKDKEIDRKGHNSFPPQRPQGIFQIGHWAAATYHDLLAENALADNHFDHADPFLIELDQTNRARATATTGTYLWNMENKARSSKGPSKRSKLTLSVRPEYVAMLRKASARKGRSISELVEELAEKLNDEPGIGERGAAFIQRHLGVLAGKIGPEDWKREDRIGDILRKHAPQ